MMLSRYCGDAEILINKTPGQIVWPGVITYYVLWIKIRIY